MVGLFSKSLFSKLQYLAFFKTKFGLFHFQAPGNPAGESHRGTFASPIHPWPFGILQAHGTVSVYSIHTPASIQLAPSIQRGRSRVPGLHSGIAAGSIEAGTQGLGR